MERGKFRERESIESELMWKVSRFTFDRLFFTGLGPLLYVAVCKKDLRSQSFAGRWWTHPKEACLAEQLPWFQFNLLFEGCFLVLCCVVLCCVYRVLTTKELYDHCHRRFQFRRGWY